MEMFEVEIPQSKIDALEARAVRLSALVDAATHSSENRNTRESGSLLADRIMEWVDEIKDLRAIGDKDVLEKIQSFSMRLHMAEQKIKSWPLPKELRKEFAPKKSRKRNKNSVRAA